MYMKLSIQIQVGAGYQKLYLILKLINQMN